jgi:hypothetical protein
VGTIKNPKRFSEQFGVPPKTLKSLGALDPVLNADTRLFIDPLLLQKSAQPEMREAWTDWDRHFGKLVALLQHAQDPSDPAWRAADKLLSFKEFKGTCLGYGSGSIRGSALPRTKRASIMKTARRIVELGILDPELFALIPLLEEGVGPDSISDMTSHVISYRLAQFTGRVLAGCNVPQLVFAFGEQKISLPVNPYESTTRAPVPVVLVPRDVLKDLPVALDRDDISRVVAENESLRARINATIGDALRRYSSKKKHELKAVVLNNREAFETLLAIFKAAPKSPYNLDVDPDGRVKWLDIGKRIATDFPVQLTLQTSDAEGVRQVVEQIMGNYKQVIEDQGIWKLLYETTGKPLHEHVAQKVFFVMADAYCKANNLDITPEANSGNGPVDFKLSRGYSTRVVVELKLSTNSKLSHGYSEQLQIYKRAERTDTGFLVVLDVGKGTKQLDRLLKLESQARINGEHHSPVTVIDAKPKKSASVR